MTDGPYKDAVFGLDAAIARNSFDKHDLEVLSAVREDQRVP